MLKIGFIGLGHMGQPMVGNLLAAGHEVKVFDISEEAVNQCVAKGACKGKSIAEVTEGSDFVITMLQTSEQVSKSCLGEKGFLDNKGIFFHLSKKAVYIDCSSISMMTSKVLHQEAKHFGLSMLDAPVSGGVKGARAKTLTFMVGGDEDIFVHAKSILECMGKKVVYAGKGGLGQAAKICNNMILGISMIAISEAFALAEKLGLDSKTFFEISSNASGQCWAMNHYLPIPNILEDVPANQNYKPGFTVKMMLKDLKLSQDAALHVNMQTTLGAQATAMYQNFNDEGNEELDFSSIIKKIKKDEEP